MPPRVVSAAAPPRMRLRASPASPVGGGAVEVEVEGLVGGHAQGQRVGAEHALHAPGGSHRGPGVGARHAHAAGLRGHGGVVARDAVVAGVAGDHHAHAVGLGLFDGKLHAPVADHLAHAVVAVHHRRGGGVFDDLKARHGVLDPGLDTVQVDGLEAVHAVGLDAPPVRLQQVVRAERRVLRRYAAAREDLRHKIRNRPPVHGHLRHFARLPKATIPGCRSVYSPPGRRIRSRRSGRPRWSSW